MNDPVALFLIFLRAATFSIGGQGALPLLRQDLVDSGLLTEGQILEALTIGRLAPGPTGLYITSIGYFVAGPLGAVLALIAASIPPIGMIAIAMAVRRQLLSGWAAGLVRGVVLASAALLVATALRLISPDLRLTDVAAWQLVLAALGTVLTMDGRMHPAVMLAGGALAGMLFGR